MEIEKRIFSVSEITFYIKMTLEDDEILNGLYLRGEVSSPQTYSSGNTYFTLKDEENQIRCIMFGRVYENVAFNIEHGMKVILKGSIEVYGPRGEYKVVVEEIQPDGLGALNMAFMQLKEKLEKEGLFSLEHKKEIPRFPKIIGLITSLDGAVMHDVLNVLGRRYPLVKLVIAPTIVQGKEAAGPIVEAIELMNKREEVDVIILGRGGGSLEDLWGFNEESVARAIFNSKIPIISGVGHETDFTIADFVADYRAPTPSAAAEKAVPDIIELRELTEGLGERMANSILDLVKIDRALVDQLANRTVFKRPLEAIHAYYQKIEYLEYMLKAGTSQKMVLKRKILEILDSKINALNPSAILSRGYSIVLKDGKTVKNSSDVQIDNNINIMLHRGELEARVNKIKN